jgi:hypothetical protein
MKTPRWLTNHEICVQLGYAQTPGGVQNARRAVLRRIEAGGAKLAKYDPRVDRRAVIRGPKSRADCRWKITLSGLKKIFPELVDDQVELGEELKAKLAEISAVVDEAFARIEKTAAASRKRDEVLANAIRELRKGPQTY